MQRRQRWGDSNEPVQSRPWMDFLVQKNRSFLSGSLEIVSSRAWLRAGTRVVCGGRPGWVRLSALLASTSCCHLPVYLWVLPSQLCSETWGPCSWGLLGVMSHALALALVLGEVVPWILVLKASGSLSGAGREGRRGEEEKTREGWRVNKHNHSNDLPSSSSLTRPH